MIEVCTVFNNIVARSLCHIIRLCIHDDVCLDAVLPEDRNVAIIAVVSIYIYIRYAYSVARKYYIGIMMRKKRITLTAKRRRRLLSVRFVFELDFFPPRAQTSNYIDKYNGCIDCMGTRLV